MLFSVLVLYFNKEINNFMHLPQDDKISDTFYFLIILCLQYTLFTIYMYCLYNPENHKAILIVKSDILTSF